MSSILRSGGLMFIGEAPAFNGRSFSPSAEQVFHQALGMAGLSLGNISLTNVFDVAPPQGNLDAWGIKLPEAQKQLRSFDCSPEFLTPVPGYKLIIRPEISVPALQRLKSEISKVRPTCIVALGNTALRALCGVSGIGKLRGAIHPGLLYPAKVLPTYHPASLLKSFDNIPITAMDFRKALIESAYPEVRSYPRKISIIQELADLATAEQELLAGDYLTFDIETKARQMTCIGLSGSLDHTFVLPFWSRAATGWSYWADAAAEIASLCWLKKILESDMPKIAQNGLYDIQYLMCYGIGVRRYTHDTMLIQHSLFPSLPKGLDFLGSLYCNERAWKRMRPRKGEQKKEE